MGFKIQSFLGRFTCAKADVVKLAELLRGRVPRVVSTDPCSVIDMAHLPLASGQPRRRQTSVGMQFHFYFETI